MEQPIAGRLINDRYRLETILGQGGMGVVYRGIDTLLERTVAVKLLNEAGLGSEGRARLLNEARAAAQLNHPNIVSIYDAGLTGNAPYIVMELVEGASLYDQYPDNLTQILSITRQICSALEHAHANHIIHRDLKPENVLVTPAGLAKLTDFGLARSLTSRLSTTGAISGSVLYMAPEMALNQPVDGRSDLYALGVMLYELVCGRLPFNADSPLAVISQHIHAPVVPPSTYRADLPPDIEKVILKLLAKDPGQRFQTAQAVIQALDEAETHSQDARQPILPEGKDVDTLLEQLASGRLVGRRDELETLRRLWQGTLKGRTHLALISGEPGIGKTRLANELIVYARLGGAEVLRGGCYEYEAASPYLPFVEALREWVHRQDDDNLLRALGAQASEIAKLAPEVESRLGPLATNPSLEANDERLRLFDHVARVFQRLAAPSGLLLFIDDIHWADQGTLSLLHYLLRHLRQESFMVMACYREVELDRLHAFADALVEWNRERLATRISLSRLDIAEVGQLLASLFAMESTSDEFTQAIYRETEGNPFFIEEVIKSLIEQKQIYWEDRRWQRQEIADLAIPQSIKEAIGRRLSRQSTDCIEMLHTAAALGKRFTFAELGAAAGQDENALLDALDEASDAQLVRVESADSYVFTHDKIREVLYEELNPIRRRRLHLRIGEGLERLYGTESGSTLLPISGGNAQVRSTAVESLAHHFIEGGDLEKGLRYSIRAGDLARKVFALDEALHDYQHALECAEGLQYVEELASIFEKLALVQEQRGLVQDAIGSLEHALKLVQAPRDRARLKTLLGALYAVAGDERGRAHLLAALDELDPQTQRRELARANAVLGRYYHLHAEWTSAIQYLERARQIAEPLEDPSVLYEIYAYLAGAYQQGGDFKTSMEWAERNIALGERSGLLMSVAVGHEFLAEDYYATRQWQKAIEHAQIVLQISEKIGSFQRQAWGLNSLAHGYYGLGELSKAMQAGDDCLEIAERTGDERLAALIRGMRANIYGDLDDFEVAWGEADFVTQRAQVTGHGQVLIWSLDARVYLYVLQERWQEFLDLLAQVQVEVGERYWGQKMVAYLALDRKQDLLQLLDKYPDVRREIEDFVSSGWYWFVIARVHAYLGDRNEAAASFEKAIADFESLAERIGLGQTLSERARFYLQDGQVELARQDSQRALELFTYCGATHFRLDVEKFLNLLPA